MTVISTGEGKSRGEEEGTRGMAPLFLLLLEKGKNLFFWALLCMRVSGIFFEYKHPFRAVEV